MGTDIALKTPCIDPSSPSVPCSTGKATSNPIVLSAVFHKGFIALRDRLSGCPCSISFETEVVKYQAPRVEMPTGIGSKRSRSIYSKMFFAELMETPCSTERPPKRMATLFLVIHKYMTK